MKEWTPRIIILALLAVVIGVPFLLRPAVARREGDAKLASKSGERLVILTPHNEQIRYEINRAFAEWRRKQGKPAVEIDWRTGGTSELRKQILTEFEARVKAGEEDKGIEKDLLFGGGDYEHNILVRGITTNRGDKDVTVSLVETIQFPAGEFEKAFPSDKIGSSPLYQKDRLWVGVALSSFGIVYNRDKLAQLGLPEPTTWSDLREGRYRQWIALADPAHSSSIGVTYNTILQRQGWTEGWATLRRTFANARYFTASSSKVPVDVSAGEAAAGMCIDFYGRFQAGAVNPDGGRGRVGYIDPPYMTAITPDPICILRGAPQRELANEFVVWLLSSEAQGLWQRKKGIAEGNESFELRRMPIRRDVFTPEEMAKWVDDVRPYEIAKPIPNAMPSFYDAVAPIAHAMAIDIHDELKDAWDAILDNPEHPRRSEMLALFDRMPPELTLTWPDAELAANWGRIIEDPQHPRYADAAKTLKDFADGLSARYGKWKDKDKILRDRIAWTDFFRENYRAIVRELD
jgi:ABC-type Fe3+ transport system substrate-binding protein